MKALRRVRNKTALTYLSLAACVLATWIGPPVQLATALPSCTGSAEQCGGLCSDETTACSEQCVGYARSCFLDLWPCYWRCLGYYCGCDGAKIPRGETEREGGTDGLQSGGPNPVLDLLSPETRQIVETLLEATNDAQADRAILDRVEEIIERELGRNLRADELWIDDTAESSDSFDPLASF